LGPLNDRVDGLQSKGLDMKEPMSQASISSKPNKRICEGADCFAEATETISIKVGAQRKISLNLCSNCVTKF
jgi:hypothetical protein